MACQHKRYSIDTREQVGNCIDCGAEGRMQFVICGAAVTEDFCGVPMDISARETRAGTAHRVCKWTCPTCGKACSMLEIDDEWCHGDSMSIRYKDGQRRVGCGACWLDA